MAAKVFKGENLKPGTILVFSNGVWKDTNNTPWEGIERSRPFQRHLQELKAGKTQYYRNRSFLMVVEEKK